MEITSDALYVTEHFAIDSTRCFRCLLKCIVYNDLWLKNRPFLFHRAIYMCTSSATRDNDLLYKHINADNNKQRIYQTNSI